MSEREPQVFKGVIRTPFTSSSTPRGLVNHFSMDSRLEGANTVRRTVILNSSPNNETLMRIKPGKEVVVIGREFVTRKTTPSGHKKSITRIRATYIQFPSEE